MNILKNKTIIVTGIIMLIILGISLYLLYIPKRGGHLSPPPPPTPTVKNKSLNTSVINNVSPAQSQLLTPGNTQTFTVFLGKALYMDQIKITLKGYDYTQNDTTPVDIPFDANFTSNNIITIRTKGPIAPHMTYSLTIVTTSDNRPILDLSYSSKSSAGITPVSSNNTALATYLPYETDAYKLSYLPSKNVYIFNFKYNPNSGVSIGDQFAAAQQDATRFIQSKGIDINSIVIEWKNN